MEEESVSKTFAIFCWNIQNPSLERAEKQFAWLQKQLFDVLILTECKKSEGCLFLETYLRGRGLFQICGYNVVFPKPKEDEYGVLIASRRKLTPSPFSNCVKHPSARVNSVTLSFFDEEIELVGIYAPSRGFSTGRRREKKRLFVKSFVEALEATLVSPHRILCGDLNVLEPDHMPHYPKFEDWEYDFYRAIRGHGLQDAFRILHPTAQEHSWFGKSGEGYRYDHCFVSLDLVPLVDECYYLHEPRELRLSDHSALVTIFKMPCTSERNSDLGK